jgi:hypothetical protein
MHGKILFNGNMGSVATYLERIAQFVLAAGRTPRVLIVNAAWKAGEGDDAPIRAAIEAIGVPAEQISNLGVWTARATFLAARGDVDAITAEVDQGTEAIRPF